MSSPSPSTTSATDAHAASRTQEQITFRFCRECSNMLYPKEDRMTNKLMFACRTCQFSEEAQSSCVFRNNMYNTVGETAGVTQDVGSDPTVGDPDSLESDFECGFCCTLCGRVLDGSFEEEEDEGMEDDEEEMKLETGVEGIGDDKEGIVRVTIFDLDEMTRMEEEEAEDEGLDQDAESPPTHNEKASPETGGGGFPSRQKTQITRPHNTSS